MLALLFRHVVYQRGLSSGGGQKRLQGTRLPIVVRGDGGEEEGSWLRGEPSERLWPCVGRAS